MALTKTSRQCASNPALRFIRGTGSRVRYAVRAAVFSAQLEIVNFFLKNRQSIAYPSGRESYENINPAYVRVGFERKRPGNYTSVLQSLSAQSARPIGA